MAKCPAFVRGCRMRVTKLDTCGRPVAGAANKVVTAGFIELNLSAQVEEGEEILVRNACGQICVNDPGCPELSHYEVELQLCNVDFDLVTLMMPTARRIVNRAGETIGFADGTTVSCDAGVAIEIWTNVFSDAGCAAGQTSQDYGYILLPWVVNAISGDLDITNDHIPFTINAITKKGAGWGIGPYNIEQDTNGSYPLLDPVEADEHRVWLITQLPPPAAACGASAVVVPVPPTVTIVEDETDATGMTAEATAVPGKVGDTMTIDWGDGTAPAPIAATPVVHQYTTPGTYRVEVREKVLPAPTDGSASETVTFQDVTVPFP